MRDSGIKIAYDSYIEDLFNELSHPGHENSPCQGIENVSIFVNKKRWKKRKKHYVFEHAQQPPIAFRLSRLSKPSDKGLITRHSSMPELSKCTKLVPPRIRSGHGKEITQKHNNYKQTPFQSKFIANVFSEHRFDNWFLNPNYPSQTKWKIYRCQLGVVEDSCCCNCTSDAMFEVMKGLYDCYKAKNCDGCDCVLCGYKSREERKLGELRKSMTSTAREKILEGKTPEEKEFILKEMAKTRQALPSGKTASDKALIDKTRRELGLPPSPKTASEKAKMRKAEAAGIITPLEGKTAEEKEKILRAQADMGLQLPEGRTDSEKALIEKIKAKKRSTKSALLTPLTGKTPEEKERILRGRAMKGLPLPEAETPSEKKLLAKVRADLGLPKEPTTKSLREKYDKAAKAGLLQPLEGKTPAEKEKTLQGLRSLGIPLPEGRTPSEKALIAKVKASPRSIVTPSEQMRRAKEEGLITPLTGKTPEQKEKIIKGLAMKGLALPEPATASEKKLIDKIRADLGLPKEPTTKSLKAKFEQAAKAGLLQPLEGMTPEEKEKTLKGLYDLGIPLPEGRTPSEKAIVAKVKSTPRAGSIKTAGMMTPLTGKAPEQKEKILRKRAMKGIPLPEGVTPSEKQLVEKVRADLGLPPEPATKSLRDKHELAAKAGLLEPLEGKTPAQKEAQLKGLRDLGIPLPEGRTPSEKALIAKVKAAPRSLVAPSEQLRRAKAEGLMTPLSGKTPAQKEKILKGLAMKGLLLPEGKTPSEKKLIDKVRDELGLPKEPDTKSLKDKYEKAAKAGFLQPLLGKTPEEKERILQGQYDLGIPLPEGRTPSEKSLINKIKAVPAGSIKTAGVMTPLTGKTQAQKEKLLRARAMKGIPLPEGVTPSEKKMIDKVRADLGLPAEPTTKSLRDKHELAAKAGLLVPLEGKTPAQKEAQLKGLRDMGIPLPEGRTPSEKALIAKVKGAPRSLVAPSEQLRRAKAEGLLTPLSGKTPAQKEKILKGLAMKGLLLPEGKTPSEKQLIDKVRDDLGLPKEPDTKSMKDKHEKAAKAGFLQPLLGKTPEEKERILQGQYDLGIPLPEGRTPSEKSLINKIKAVPAGSIKTAGVMTPLTGKTQAQKEKILRARAMKGIPLPEGVSPSEKVIIDKVRADLGLPAEPTTKSLRDKHELAAKAGLLVPLEGKTPAQKEAQLKALRDMGIPLPEGRTPSEKALIAKVKGAPRSLVAPSEQLRRAKAEGLMTPLSGKTPAQKEKILKGLAMKGLLLPEGKTPSEKKLIDKVRDDLGLPKEPDTKSMKEKYEKAAKAGFLQPLIGKTPEEKEKILQGQFDMGIPLPEGRTPSEKSLIAKIKAGPPSGSIKTAGLMTPLTGKSPAYKEKVLRARVMKGIPLPEGVSPSEKVIIDKVRADLGLPPEPTTKSLRDKHELAAKAGLLGPLEGKTPAQKEAQLKGLRDLGIPLPEGRTPSEKALIAKVKGAPRSLVAPSEQLRRAKAEGLITPLSGKTPAQKEKILKGLAMKGLLLPEGKTPSEKKLIDKIRDDLGLPQEPDTKSMKDKHEKAAKAGLLQPLLGKTLEEKEKILQGQYDLGIPLPEGRTPSEKSLINKIKAVPAGSIKTAGVMTPLTGKTQAQKEKILRARAMKGIPLPEGVSPSEKVIIDKVRADLGLPAEPTTKSLRDKHELAAKAGLLVPLEGKTPAQKEAQLKGLRDMGIPLPEGRTPSEKALIAKIKGAPRSLVAPSEQLRRAKAEGLITPLSGKTPAQKEKILKGLAMKGLLLPEGKTPSEKKLIDKVRDDLGLPKEPDTKSMKDKYEKAAKAGFLQPLLGKTAEEKEKILQGQFDLGIPLPEGRTPSEKSLIAKIKKGPPSIKTAGLMTPLTGKSPAHKEKILRARAMKGVPLPEGTTPSEKAIIDKVRADLGLPPEPTTKSLRDKHEQAAKAGFLQPLVGKTPEEKEKILQGQYDLGIPLPEGKTPSEKALIDKIKALPAGSIKTAGVMTPLTGRTPAQKEKILRARVMKGIPLPEGVSPSEKVIIDKVRADLGLPPEPTTKSLRDKHELAAKAGLLGPLEGKTPAQKEAQLKGLRDLGIPLPEGRTPSEKALIAKVKGAPRSLVAPSEQLRRAKAEGLITPLSGKTPAQKEKILKGLAMKGLLLPEGKTPSEKKLIDKVREDLGLPKEPDTKSMKEKYDQAAKAGLLQPLLGKTAEEKEKILQGQFDLGIPLPEGRTPSEKSLIAKIKKGPPSIKTAGLMTPLTGKSPAHKEKILRARAMKGVPLPEGTTPSEKAIIDKVRADLGLPPEPTTKSLRDKHEQAAKAGFLQPLVGKTPEEKEKILQGQYDLGIPLPEGKTPSEKALIDKIKALPAGSIKTAGVMTPLTGRTQAQKEKILRARVMKGIPLPEGVSPSEKVIIDKVRADLGLPPEPTTKSLRDKHELAAKAGLLGPLEGKTPAQKEAQLKGLRDLGIPLPEGRTPSEKALIAKVKGAPRSLVAPSEQLRRAKAEGLITPLSGKTPAQKEKILKGLAMKGLLLPEGKTPSEKKLIDKVREDLGLPKEPDTKSMKEKYDQAAKAGLLQPLLGKTAEEKEKILQGQFDLGIPLPEGRTPSEKSLIAKIKKGPPSIKTAGLMTPLTGKSPAHKEKILRARAMKGVPLPEGTTPSEKAIIDKVRADLGLPPEPTTKSLRDKHEQAAKAGFLQPLVGKTPEEKEKILQGQYDLGIPLPEGKTPSEKALIDKIKALPAGSIKTAGVMTPLTGRTPAQKEKILRARVMKGIPLPEGVSPSEKVIIDKVRADLGLPPEPTTKSLRDKHELAAKAGLLGPLEGKTPAQKEAQLKGLRDLGIPLPEGRTPSEKALIAKVKGAPRSLVAPSEQLRRAKAEGLITPLSGKTPAQKEKILKGLAMKGLLLPEGKTPSEKKLIDKVREDLGLPKEPDTKSMKEKYDQAAKAGLLQPLLGKTAEEKEKILQGQFDLGIPLPEGRTPSEKSLIAKIKKGPPSIKTAGLMTPLTGKSPAHKEKILRARAMKGVPLPEGTTPSEKAIIDKVRADLGLPPEPTTKSLRDKHEQAAKAGFLQPLVGKTPEEKEKILQGQYDLGIPLPEGKTPSEKALIDKIKALPAGSIKTAGVMTPLTGRTPAQKEKILRARVMKGIPLPEGVSPSEKVIIDKVRADLGLPPEPTTKSLRDKHELAAKAGLLGPLEGKTPAQKEAQLKGLRDLGIPLPEGRTPSEKALIAKVKGAPRSLVAPSEQLRRAKAEGLITPLSGKTPAQKEKILKGLAMKGLLLPEGKTPSEKKLIDKVREDLGLPKEPDTKSMKEKYDQAAKAGLLQPLLGKTAEEKEKILQGQFDLGIPLPEGRTPSEKSLIAKIKKGPPSIKTAGLMTPLTGKSPAHKEKILRARAMKGVPLPEGTTPSEKAIIDKVRADLGLPPEPTTKSLRDKHEQAAKAGFLQPLVGKTPEEKEKILQGQYDLGIPLPEGKTPSEKALIDKIKALPAGSIKTAGIMTPLTGRTPAQKEKILRARAMKGVPLPEGTTPSEKAIIDKVRADLGLPPEPTTKSLRDKHEQAAKAGFLQPLVGKTPEEKEKILQGQFDFGIPLPEGQTPSEKALIAKIKAGPPSIKTAGLMTPLTGKSPAQKERILRARAMKGVPLPEGTTPSEKAIIDKVRADLGLPPEPTTKSLRDKHEQAAKAGFLQPLVGKTPEEKEKILQGQYDLGIPLPEGKTPSEKALINKIKALPAGSIKTGGIMTPLTGRTQAQKEKILRARAMKGIPLPEGTSPSEKIIIDKVRADLGLPPEPTTKSLRDKHEQAAKAGLLDPLEGKTPAQKEAQLKGLRDMGIPLPEGRTPSEKALIAKIKGAPRSVAALSEQLRRAKAEGLMTPLTGKTPAQKEKILKGLAMKGLPLPEGASPSEKILIDKVREDLGIPKEPESKSMKEKYDQAAKAGLLQPLLGKTPEEKEKILQAQHDLGIPLPEGRTPSEKALIAKVKASPRLPVAPSEQMRRAKAEGLLTPLKGKTPEQKEKILRGLAMKGLPLPEPQSPSEKKLADKVRAELGLPKEPTTKSLREKFEQAAKAGLLQPLEGMTPEEKEKTLKSLQDMGIPLPEGRTPSEKALIAKVASTKKAASVPTITTERIKKAKAAGLFTPLKGKTPEQKEKILQGLAKAGLPLPEGKTPSDMELIEKVKKEFGVPEVAPAEKLRRAKAAGLLTPLEGKTKAQKEKILRGRAAAGLPLPVGKTPSEKSLIKKIKDTTGYVTPSPSEKLQTAKVAGLLTPLKGKSPSMKVKILKGLKAAGVPIPEGETPSEKKLISQFISKPKIEIEGVPSDKVRAAKAAGLLTPLEGKTPAQKEKIIKGLAEAGLPLPEGKTKSEKSMIAKIKARIPPEGATPSEKSIIGKAKAAGLFTPITGKAPAEKERILRGLAEAGLPLPEGKTASEKELVKKIRAEAGLPPEATPSEKKGKIRKKTKKVGVSASKRAAGISAEEFEDIIKTTKCDRGCGCDRKKIRFKHSYVKIRVTSPDISSFCDCPGECFPQVKNGAFIDNDGIKVTVGSAVGIPSYSMMCINRTVPDTIEFHTDVSTTQIIYNNKFNVVEETNYKLSSYEFGLNNSRNKDNFNVTSSDISFSYNPYNAESENNYLHSSKEYRGSNSLKDLALLEDIYKEPLSNSKSASSFDTILIIRNDMSLSTSTSISMETISLTSVWNSSNSSSSAHYSGYQSTNDLLSMNSLDGLTTSDDYIDHPTVRERNAVKNIAATQKYTILRVSQLEDNFGNNKMKKTMTEPETDDPVVLFNDLPTELDVSKIMFKIMSKKRYAGASSIFIVVPNTEDEEEYCSTQCDDSMTSVRSSECRFTANTTSFVDPDLALRPHRFTEPDERDCRKGKTFYLQELSSHSDTGTLNKNESEPDLRRIEMTKDEFYQISRSNKIADMLHEVHGAETALTADRPFCSRKDHYSRTLKNISRKITPLFLQGKSLSWFRCKKSESTADAIPRCVDPNFSAFLPCSRCLQDRSEQPQTTMSPSVSSCSADVLNRTDPVQMPIKSKRHECRAVPKKAGVAWFRSGWRKASASSSVPGCDIPLCSDLNSSPISQSSCHHGRIQQQQTAVSPTPDPCLSDLEVTSNTSVKEGKSYSWFHKPGTRKARASCALPPSCDYRFCPAPNYCYHRCRGQQNHRKNQQENSKVPKNPAAKVGSRFCLPGKRKAPVRCNTPPPCKLRNNRPSRHQQPLVKRNRPDTAQKPCLKSMRQEGETTPKISGAPKWLTWTRLPSQRKISALSITTCSAPQYLDSSCSPVQPDHPRHFGCNQQIQTSTLTPPCVNQPVDLTVKTRTAKVQKPSLESAYHEGETTPTKTGVSSSWSIFPRGTRTRKTSVPSIARRKVPHYLDSSCSPLPPDQPRHLDCNQQTSATPSFCPYATDDLKGERRRSDVSLSWSIFPRGTCTRQTSVPSIATREVPQYLDSSCSPVPPDQPRHLDSYQQKRTSATPSFYPYFPEDLKEKRHRSDVSLSWSIFPRGTCTRQTSVPSIATREVPQYLDSSCSPVPPNRFHFDGCNQQNQASTTSSLRAYPLDDLNKRRRSGMKISWSRLPYQCETSVPSIPTRRVPRYQDSSTNSVPPDHPRTYELSQQCQTFAHPSHPEDLEGRRTRTAKVQKPSIQSLCHEGQTTSKGTNVTVSWSLFPSKHKISEPSIPKDGLPQCLHGRNERTQTPESFCGYPSYDLQEMRKLPVQVQKPSVGIICQNRRFHHKNAGIVSGWFRLPSTLMASVKVPSTLKDRLSLKTSKPNNVVLSDSNPDTSGQANGSQISQPQKISATKQKDFREICCLFRKPNPMHTEPAKETIKLAGSSGQQPGKLANDIMPLQQKLASVQTVDHKGDKIMSPSINHQPSLVLSKSVEFGNSKDPKNPRTKRESKEVKPKLNTVTLSDLKLASEKAGRQVMLEKITQTEEKILAKQKGFQTKCRSCLKQNQMPHQGLAKEAFTLPIPIGQQLEKITKELTLVQQKLAKTIKTSEEKEDKPMSHIKLDNHKNPKGTQTNGESKDDKLNCCPCPKQISEPELTKEVLKPPGPQIEQQLASTKTVEQQTKESECNCEEDKAVSPKEMITKAAKLFIDMKKTIIPRINDTLKSLAGQKELDNPKYSRNPRDREEECDCKEGEPVSMKGLNISGSRKQRDREVACECKKGKQMSTKGINSPVTKKQRDREVICECKEGKPISTKDLNSPRTTGQRNQEGKPMTTKDLSSPGSTEPKGQEGTPISTKDLNRPETTEKKEQEGKPMNTKDLNNSGTTKQKEQQDKPMSIKRLESLGSTEQKEQDGKLMGTKDLSSSGTTGKKEQEDKPMSTKDLNIPGITIKKDQEDKTMNTKRLKSLGSTEQKEQDGKLMGTKDLSSSGTTGKKEQEDKPMSTKDLNISGTTIKKEQEDKTMSTKRLKSLGSTEQKEQDGKLMGTKDLSSSGTTGKKEQEDKPMSTKDLNIPGTTIKKEQEGKPMSTKRLKSLGSTKQKEQDGKLMSTKDRSSPGTTEPKGQESKPMTTKDQSSPRTTEPKRQEGKSMSTKRLNSLGTTEQKVQEGKLMSTEDLNSSGTTKQKEQEGKPMKSKDLSSPGTTEIKEQEGKPISNKGLNSPGTKKQMDREVVCECKAEKPRNTKDLNSTGSSKQKEQEVKATCICKKDENVTCKCEKDTTKQSPMRHKRCPPRLPPVLIGLPPVETPEGRLYEGIGPSCKWLDTGVMRRLRSELTHSTSGFKACKRKKLQQTQDVENIELDFGDAIRYFASMNPKRFQQLIQEELESQRKAEEDKLIEEKLLAEEMEKAQKKSEKEAKKRKADKTTSLDKLPISDESESDYPQGLKFSFIVKDGPIALAGVNCTKKNRWR